MTTYRVRDRSGGTLEVQSKEQADHFVSLGYTVVTDEKPTKTTATKSSTKK